MSGEFTYIPQNGINRLTVLTTATCHLDPASSALAADSKAGSAACSASSASAWARWKPVPGSLEGLFGLWHPPKKRGPNGEGSPRTIGPMVVGLPCPFGPLFFGGFHLSERPFLVGFTRRPKEGGHPMVLGLASQGFLSGNQQKPRETDPVFEKKDG